MPGCKLRKVDWRDVATAREIGHAAVRQLLSVGAKVHFGMQVAQHRVEHTAQLTHMQHAYTEPMDEAENDSPLRPYRVARQHNLKVLLNEAGGPAQMERLTGTPKSHFSALTRSNRPRQLGDDLATKLEEVMAKPFGWLDNPYAAITNDVLAKVKSSAAHYAVGEPVAKYHQRGAACAGFSPELNKVLTEASPMLLIVLEGILRDHLRMPPLPRDAQT